jgi:hypothetical protein
MLSAKEQERLANWIDLVLAQELRRQGCLKK